MWSLHTQPARTAEVWCGHLALWAQRKLGDLSLFDAGAAAWSLHMPKSPSRQLTVTPTPSPAPSTSTSISFSPSLRQVSKNCCARGDKVHVVSQWFWFLLKGMARTSAQQIYGVVFLPGTGLTEPSSCNRCLYITLSTALLLASNSPVENVLNGGHALGTEGAAAPPREGLQQRGLHHTCQEYEGHAWQSREGQP